MTIGLVSRGPAGPRTTRFRWDGLQVDLGRATHHLALPGETVHVVVWRRTARPWASRVRLHLHPYEGAATASPLEVVIPAGQREASAPLGEHVGLPGEGVACVQLRLSVEAEGKQGAPINVTLMRGLGPPTSPWVPGGHPRELRTPWLSLLRSACTFAAGARTPMEAATRLAECIWRGLPYDGHLTLAYKGLSPGGRSAGELSWACDVFLDEPDRPGGAELSRFWDLDRLSMALTGRLERGTTLEVHCGDCSLLLVALLACLGVDASTARLCHVQGDGYGVVLPTHRLIRGAEGLAGYNFHEVVLLATGEVLDPTARLIDEAGSVAVYANLEACIARLGTETPLGLLAIYAGPAPIHPRERRKLRVGHGCEAAKAAAVGVLPALAREAIGSLARLEAAAAPRVATACVPLGRDRYEVSVHAWDAAGGPDAVVRTVVDSHGEPLSADVMDAELRRQAPLYPSTDVGFNPHRRTVAGGRCPVAIAAWGDGPADTLGARLDRAPPRA